MKIKIKKKKMVRYCPRGSYKTVEVLKSAVPIDALLAQDQHGNHLYIHPEDIQIPPNPIRNPLNKTQKKEALEALGYIQEVHPLGEKEWLEGFEIEPNPDQQIALWLTYGELYSQVSAGRTLQEKREIWRLLLRYLQRRDVKAILKKTSFQHISKEEARMILGFCKKPDSFPSKITN
jgi:hypothetical protein